jgi:limonene-1,2-epoxide hydrolase
MNPANSPEQIVRDFCAAIPRLDVKELVGFFSEDAIYHNIPIAEVQGTEAITATLNQFLAPSEAGEFEILALAVDGNRVLTERVDRFTVGGKQVALPVMGTFEVNPEGKITAWRDYFDMKQFTSQLG